MSELNAARAAGESIEQVAFKLLIMVGEAEKNLTGSGSPRTDASIDRSWILDTFSECLQAARGSRSFKK